MTDFRYAQFCPLTRAVEIVGERWTLLILRELFLGARRFNDLKSALNGVSPSVLTERLTRLEERGIVLRRIVPPSSLPVYELGEAGRALAPVLADLTRWGMRFLGTPSPEDRIRPEWLLLGLQAFARTTATDPVSARLRIENDGERVDIHVRGGAGGTTISATQIPFDVTVLGSPMDMLAFLSGFVPLRASSLACEGNLDVARTLPSLFDFRPAEAPEPIVRPSPPSDTPRSARRPRKPMRQAAPRGRSLDNRTSTGGEPQ